MAKHPGERLRIALISERASPLAAAGGVDSGGQDIYVNQIARAMARAGHRVDVFTRRDDATQSPVVHTRPGMRVIHVPAGPPHFVPKEKLLPHTADFARQTEAIARASGGYDVAHANCFLSGVAAMRMRRALGVPFVITLHALGLAERQHHGVDCGWLDDRIAVERELGLKREITNVNGSGIALGHPIGATGARIMITLLYAMRKRGKRLGLATLCGGGGVSMATAIEVCSL